MLVEEIRDSGSMRVKTMIEGESMTEQSHRDAVDINSIVARARKGILPISTGVEPNYGDFSSGVDYHQACDRILDAKRDFMTLPANVRKTFENNPGNMIEFMSNPDNLEAAREMGLVPRGATIADEPKEMPPKDEPAPEPVKATA